jgi:ketosteroid isomerase-like protein
MVQEKQLDERTAETLAAARAVDEAINRRDVEAVMAAMTDDVVWETTSPPDGERHLGAAAVRAAGEAFLTSSPNAAFESEEWIALGDRAVQRWLYRWVEADGTTGHVRGVDIYRVRDGKVAEILSYVKG